MVLFNLKPPLSVFEQMTQWLASTAAPRTAREFMDIENKANSAWFRAWDEFSMATTLSNGCTVILLLFLSALIAGENLNAVVSRLSNCQGAINDVIAGLGLSKENSAAISTTASTTENNCDIPRTSSNVKINDELNAK